MIQTMTINQIISLSIQFSFFQYLCGRLLDFVTDVSFSSKMMIVTYLESRVTIIKFGRDVDFASGDSIEKADPKVHLVDILGPAGRRYGKQQMN